MSGLFGSLNNSVKALNAQTRGVETAGRNLANVNNTDYARQRVVFGDRGTVQTSMGPASLGLEALGIEQIRDSLLDQQVTREISLTSELEALQSALDMAQAGLGQSVDRSSSTTSTDSTSAGISEGLTNFFNAFSSLAAKPTDAAEKQVLIQKAMILTEGLQQADERLAQVQTDMTSEISSDMNTANTLLQQIADLNSQINRFEQNYPGGAVDLRDSRQAKLEELAKLMNFETRTSSTYPGQIQVFTHDPTGTSEILLVDLGTAGSLAWNGTQTALVATPASGAGGAIDLSAGSMAGSMDARDTYIQDMRDQLDALAEQLVTSVNAAYGASGADFFDPANTTAATISLRTGLTAANLAAGTGASGDNSIALAVSGLASQSFSTGSGDVIDGTFSQHYTKIVTSLGQNLSGINTRLNNQENIEQIVRSQRDAVSGVSLDEEMSDLMKYQRAFQASSRVLTTIDNLLDVIVNQLIR